MIRKQENNTTLVLLGLNYQTLILFNYFTFLSIGIWLWYKTRAQPIKFFCICINALNAYHIDCYEFIDVFKNCHFNLFVVLFYSKYAFLFIDKSGAFRLALNTVGQVPNDCTLRGNWSKAGLMAHLIENHGTSLLL